MADEGITPENNPLFGIAQRNLHIGNICRHWALIEYAAAFAIWRLLRIDDDTGALLVGGMNLSTRLTTAIRLAEHLDGPPALTLYLKHARDRINSGLDERRNQAVHGFRTPRPGAFHTDLVIMHKGKHRGAEIQSNADLQDLSVEIEVLAVRFWENVFANSGLHFGGNGEKPTKIDVPTWFPPPREP